MRSSVRFGSRTTIAVPRLDQVLLARAQDTPFGRDRPGPIARWSNAPSSPGMPIDPWTPIEKVRKMSHRSDSRPAAGNVGLPVGWVGRELSRIVPGEHEMSVNTLTSRSLSQILKKHESQLVGEWIQEQSSVKGHRGQRPNESDLRRECTEFIGHLRNAVKAENDDIDSPGWDGVRNLLQDLSKSRSAQGYSPSETASFIFSLKKPLFNHLRRELNGDGQALADETWATNELLDKLGLYTTEVYQKAREEIINRQQEEMLELSTPVVKLWDGILALAHDRHARQRPHSDRHGKPVAEDRRDRLGPRDHRHHGRSDRRHPDGPAFAQDRDGGPADGGRMHHQRHPSADRADDRPPRRGSGRRHHQGNARRRPSPWPWRKPAGLSLRVKARESERKLYMEHIPILRMGEFLLVTIQVDMHDRLVMALQDDLTNRIARPGPAAS